MVLDFIEILKVIFLGIVEGITEWLPISSTGHMILVDEFITLNMSEAFKEMFFVVIQLGAILAVVVMFWNKMFPFRYITYVRANQARREDGQPQEVMNRTVPSDPRQPDTRKWHLLSSPQCVFDALRGLVFPRQSSSISSIS